MQLDNESNNKHIFTVNTQGMKTCTCTCICLKDTRVVNQLLVNYMYTVEPINNYSGTSDKGHSEKRTISLQWTLSTSLTVYFCMKLIHFQRGQPPIRDKMAGLKVSFTWRLHCTINYV